MPDKKKKATPKKKTDQSWHPLFLENLGRLPNVTVACSSCGVDHSTAYRHKKLFKRFSNDWDQALKSGVELLAAAAWKRAQTTSDTLAIFLLKTHDPDKYHPELAIKRLAAQNQQPQEIQQVTASELIKEITIKTRKPYKNPLDDGKSDDT